MMSSGDPRSAPDRPSQRTRTGNRARRRLRSRHGSALAREPGVECHRRGHLRHGLGHGSGPGCGPRTWSATSAGSGQTVHLAAGDPVQTSSPPTTRTRRFRSWSSTTGSRPGWHRAEPCSSSATSITTTARVRRTTTTTSTGIPAPPVEASATAASITARFDPDEWTVMTAEESRRTILGPSGHPTTVDDVVVRLTSPASAAPAHRERA